MKLIINQEKECKYPKGNTVIYGHNRNTINNEHNEDTVRRMDTLLAVFIKGNQVCEFPGQ